MTLKAKASLIDVEDSAGRTTASLLAALVSRLGVLHFISGSDAVASLVSGFAALGREVSKTTEGIALRQAVTASQAAANGDSLWATLRIGEGASTAIPSPVLEQLRNDVALLLAEDLDSVISMMPIPPEAPSGALPEPQQTVTFMDFLVGYYAFSREVVAAVDAMSRLAQPQKQVVVVEGEPAPPLNGSILR
jgi:hypothetical protein